MRKTFQILLVLLITSCASKKAEILSEHFKANQIVYEQLKDELFEINGDNPVASAPPSFYGEEIDSLSRLLALRPHTLVTTFIKDCDSNPKQKLMMIFEYGIEMNYSYCPVEDDSKLNGKKVVKLAKNWYLWR